MVMSDKEKLMELIASGAGCPGDRNPFGESCDSCPYEKSADCGNERLADYLIAHGVTVLPESGIGDMSDGYHTFNELYHHRAVLFSVICNLHPLCAWKAKKHHDGSMYDGMFIVGINTPEGQATYHYDIDPYWDMFRVPEAEFAPEWDGHTPDEAIRRIGLLGTDCPVQRWIPVKDRLPEENTTVIVATDNGIVFQCLYAYDGWDLWDGNEVNITHWQPMPQPPKGE